MKRKANGKVKRATGELAGLTAIIVAMVLGAVLGLLYGRSMWLAGGGLKEEIARLEMTVAQKTERAKALEEKDPAEAARLRGHVPEIESRLAEVRQLQEQRSKEGVSKLALVAWEFTKFCGDLFLQSLRLMVVPLVVTSMICGIASLGDVRHIGRVGFLTVAYFLATTLVAVVIGIVLVTAIRPGVGADDTFAFVTKNVQSQEETTAIGTLLNVVRGAPDDPNSGMIPSNILAAGAEMNVLALIFFSLVFGGALTTLGDRGKVVIDFFDAANAAIMKMVHLVMWFAPMGIFGLVAFNIAKKGGGEAFAGEVTKLGKYVATVILGLVLQGVFLLVVLKLLGKRRPLEFVMHSAEALLTGLTTGSSSATLPLTIECTEEKNGVSGRIAGFVLPLGATVNMNGTALYEAVAAVFIAQSLGMTLTFGALLVIVLTATLAAIGAAGIPEAGLVTMVIVLTAVGLPITGIGLILAIDWFLDRLRTVNNIFGDMVGAAVVERYEAAPAR
ncbi:MAG: dicarboxylate/amino acid:cation symporter [Pirellulales bacterium]|nr:dicarboxylate/amino acid:cation symporter [Pirellulales bacterium]